MLRKSGRRSARENADRKQESSKREVELHDDSPWMIARLIQFFYLGMYDTSLDEKQQSQLLSVMELVSQGSFPSESEKNDDTKRGQCQIDTIMWQLANKYNCETLREYIGKKLVLKLKLDKDLPHGTRRSRYLQACGLMRSSFHEMPEIEDGMVSILLDMKLRKYDRQSRETMAILPMHADRHTVDEHFQHKIFCWMSGNASFATKIAKALEQLLDLSMQTHDYSGARIESMKNKIRHP